MTQETMTLTKAIAECKKLKEVLVNKIDQDKKKNNFSLVSYYFKYNPFIGPRTIEQQEKYMTSTIDEVSQEIIRLFAINKARVHANATTKIKVDKIIPLKDILAGKKPTKEEITIAEAITRKKYYCEVLRVISQSLSANYTRSFADKEYFDSKAELQVKQSMDRQFPDSANRAYSNDEMAKAEARYKKENQVMVLDPYKLLDNDGITNLHDIVSEYISNIDSDLSAANASTTITVKY